MPDVTVNGRRTNVIPGTTVAAAILNCGFQTFRKSVHGQPRAPLCGMGICYECRVMVDGERHVRSCQTLCTEGMVIVTE